MDAEGGLRTHYLECPGYCESCCRGWSHPPSRCRIWSCSVASPPCWSALRWNTMSDWILGCWGGRGQARTAAAASGSGFSLSGTLALVAAWRSLTEIRHWAWLFLCFPKSADVSLWVMVPLLLYVGVIHLQLLPHGALYFCCQRVLEGNTQNMTRFSGAPGTM